MRHLLLPPAALVLSLLAPAGARAAESYDNCTGFIDSLPATISTQGVWCLRQDLSTAMTSGAAITIATNNVTIDCNDFKTGGLGGGAGTQAVGIRALSRQNATVRRCNLRGFFSGVKFDGAGSGGHVVEDSRFDGNLLNAIMLEGDGSVVRGNLVTTTGGSTVLRNRAEGIYAGADVDIIGNTIDGVLPLGQSGQANAYGIYTSFNRGGTVAGNRIRGVVNLGASPGYGIFNTSSGRLVLRGNDVVGAAIAGSVGLRCDNAQGVALENVVNGFVTGIQGCSNDGNVVKP